MAALIGLAGIAHAQSTAIERNLPPASVTSGGEIRVDETIAGSTDETPLGVDVAGIALIGPDAQVPARPQPGVSLEGIAESYHDAVRAALAPLIGQPLSPALIARAQGVVAGVWRQAGYPFMSVTVPPQEVTSGVLTLRVVEFVAGNVSSDHASLPLHVRQQPGEAISAAQLSEDLAWLNRNPFRQVGAVFAPGDQRGASDIELTVTTDKPFAVYAGWDNTGSPATGRDRFYTGGGVWIPALNDMTLSWRYTRSDELWDGNVFGLDPAKRGYLSLAGRIDLPTLPRQALSIAPNFVTTNEFIAGTPFSFENTTFELPILYRTAVSNMVPGTYWGDLYFGIEPKWLRRTTRFAGIDVAEGEAGLVNLVLGWSHLLTDPHGRTSIDLRLKANPGGVLGTNTAADWAAFTGGRVSDHTYVHAGFDIARWTRLPNDFAWSSTLTGQIAGQALPDTERLSLGGHYAVRGVEHNDVSADAGVVWRNELRLPAMRPLAGAGLADTLSPFAFLDLGWGKDNASGTSNSLAGAGLGFDYAIGTNFNAGATAAVALTDAGTTRAGDWSVTTNIRFTY
ncbi:ShlB/FhaC/HecB family hemolysin secretion/activation protein [Caldimonas thermodepolymerans]|uniref:ShlB/FhaC/HecB family hemolysin secretion/activation protein n=1 Tax=Caldimonas thermodepolymerans TaxID=215580 RepID=A0A2S5SZX0_9BURK|nr:ShlB/FhaC/HecB family hemolysin secretion/activation protein [Caldimonas thermodepolymerans]